MSRRSLVTALVVGVLSLMTLAGLFMAVVMALGDGTGLGFGGRIAVLEVDGVIADDHDFIKDLRRLQRDRSVRGWVVSINSPGGVVAPSQSIYQELSRLREDDDRPVIASIGSVGASGGYYVALGADSILALPGSITGSIGVLMEFPNVSGLMDKVGVEMQVVKAGAQKDLGSPFRAMDAEDEAILGEMVADVHAQFVEVVAAERGLSMAEVTALADGRILSGRQARERRLVDRLGNLEEAIALAGVMAGLGSEPDIVRPPEDREGLLAELLFGRTAVRALGRLADPVAGMTPVLKFIMH
ncbi:MAG TPA: signal peptide peptidase SppA [Longimicrobiales bacterium]|nr:signal peptide peptidase SppA [Longimicrobiales bacterium]